MKIANEYRERFREMAEEMGQLPIRDVDAPDLSGSWREEMLALFVFQPGQVNRYRTDGGLQYASVCGEEGGIRLLVGPVPLPDAGARTSAKDRLPGAELAEIRDCPEWLSHPMEEADFDRLTDLLGMFSREESGGGRNCAYTSRLRSLLEAGSGSERRSRNSVEIGSLLLKVLRDIGALQKRADRENRESQQSLALLCLSLDFFYESVFPSGKGCPYTKEELASGLGGSLGAEELMQVQEVFLNSLEARLYLLPKDEASQLHFERIVWNVYRGLKSGPKSIPQIEEGAGLGRGELAALTRSNLGCSPKEMVNYCMALQTMEYLDAGLTVQEIAVRQQYSSGSYLIRSFKREVGMTPVQYRNNVRALKGFGVTWRNAWRGGLFDAAGMRRSL